MSSVHMYVCIDICMYVLIYACMHWLCTCVLVCINMCILYMYVLIYVHTYDICNVCMYVCMIVILCMYIVCIWCSICIMVHDFTSLHISVYVVSHYININNILALIHSMSHTKQHPLFLIECISSSFQRSVCSESALVYQFCDGYSQQITFRENEQQGK